VWLRTPSGFGRLLRNRRERERNQLIKNNGVNSRYDDEILCGEKLIR
jgi:hypothetical protein